MFNHDDFDGIAWKYLRGEFEYITPFTFEFGDSSFEEDYILMQYTGLKDKNGKEIYEGDLVLYRKSADGFVKRWSEKPVEIIWNEKKAGFDFKGSFNGLIYSEYEVVGNIKENKDLVK
jgi:uncharacterized phage protein (TIGR01671 family)